MKNTLRFSVGVLVVIGIFGYGLADSANKKGSEAKYEEVTLKSKYGGK